MASNETGIQFSEDEYGRRLDRCITDAIIKGSGGMLLGGVLSLLFFKRRGFPILLGTGFGVGMAYKGCEKDLNS